jgi:phospholipase C
MLRTVFAGLLLALWGSMAAAQTTALPTDALPEGFEKIKTIVVIYAENRSFTHLLPDFPGTLNVEDAPKASILQKDRDGDRWGPGTRVPTVIASPYAKKGFVDHSIYDTTSILAFISKRFGLELLPGIRTQCGDLRNAFAIADD